ncbi:hypothetical protein, partial [Escherichia coli]
MARVTRGRHLPAPRAFRRAPHRALLAAEPNHASANSPLISCVIHSARVACARAHCASFVSAYATLSDEHHFGCRVRRGARHATLMFDVSRALVGGYGEHANTATLCRVGLLRR